MKNRLWIILSFAWISISIVAADNQKQDLQQLLKLPYDIQAYIAKHLLGDDIKQNLFDRSTLKHILQGHKELVNLAALNKTGTHIVSVGRDAARIWNAQTGELIHTLHAHKEGVRSAAFNEAGTHIVSIGSGLWDSNVCVWDVQTGELIHVLHGHKREITSAAFNKAGTHIVSSSFDGIICIWDVQTGALLHTLQNQFGVRSAKFNKEGTRIISTDSDAICIWDAQTGKLIGYVHGSWNASAEFNKPGTHMLATSRDAVCVYDVQTGKLIHRLRSQEPERYIRSATFNEVGTRIASIDFGRQDSKVYIWDAQTGELIHTLQHEDVEVAVFNKQGTHIVSNDKNKICIWDVQTGELVRILQGHIGSIRSVAFNRQGTQLISASWDKTIRIWDIQEKPYDYYHFSLEQAMWIYNAYHEIMHKHKVNKSQSASELLQKSCYTFDNDYQFNFYCFAPPLLPEWQEKLTQIEDKLAIEQSIKGEYPEILARLESLKLARK